MHPKSGHYLFNVIAFNEHEKIGMQYICMGTSLRYSGHLALIWFILNYVSHSKLSLWQLHHSVNLKVSALHLWKKCPVTEQKLTRSTAWPALGCSGIKPFIFFFIKQSPDIPQSFFTRWRFMVVVIFSEAGAKIHEALTSPCHWDLIRAGNMRQ